MKIDPSKIYLMPLISGPIAEKKENLRPHLGEVEFLVLEYQTDSDALQPLMPDCFQLADKPTISVWFAYYNQVDFLANRGYNEVAVQVAARFDGEKDHVEGEYVIVMFLNDTIPIIRGREQVGWPKMYADIPAAEAQPNGHLLCKATLWNQLLIIIDLAPMKKQNAIVRFAANKMANRQKLLFYKYIPSLDGPPDANYPNILPSDIKIDELWMGNSGMVSFGDPSKSDLPKQLVRLLEAMNTLPVRQVTRTMRYRGSMFIRDDLCRRLR